MRSTISAVGLNFYSEWEENYTFITAASYTPLHPEGLSYTPLHPEYSGFNRLKGLFSFLSLKNPGLN
jgi:hypothetical protein